MYNDVMTRAQIYLGEQEEELLAQVASKTGASRSELIRRAIHATFGKPQVDARLAGIAQSSGSWKNRNFTGAAYVDAIRGDLHERLHRLGLD
jgi:Ribbon-helix-helix protein, copG family